MSRSVWLLSLTIFLAACSSRTTDLVPDDAGGEATPAGDGGMSTLPGSDAGGVFDTNAEGQVLCGSEPCGCHNGLDDDGDGLVDGFDPECTGPYDDDEGSFATGIPGDNRDPRCQDCFFDGNSGSGDDGCRYATSCLVDGTPSSGSGSCATCEPQAECVDNCRPRTPNGCDCFGCCDVELGGGEVVSVQLNESCSLDAVDDLDRCPRCVPSPDCRNDCGRCELCPGREVSDLPDDCAQEPAPVDAGAPAPPAYQCDDGDVCGDGLPCEAGWYCQLGCCLPIVI